MTVRIPIGEREGERLEFKSVRALAKPEIVARAVVAMLNAGGGEVWIGLREEDAVAVEIESLEDAEDARRRLHDALVDSIEPSPLGEELRIEIEGADARILRVEVKQSQRGPFAVLLPGGGRSYQVRVGARSRPLTFDEIGERFASRTKAAERSRSAVERRRLEHDLLEALQTPGTTLWMGIDPDAGASRLDLDAVVERDYLVEPEATGNRGSGRSFYAVRRRADQEGTPYLRRTGRPDGTSLLEARGGSYELGLDETASIRVVAPLADFVFGEEEPNPRLEALRGQSVLNPRALLEYPTSVLRLLGALVRDQGLWVNGRPASFSVALALVGIEGWLLRPDPDHPYLVYPVDPRKCISPPEVLWRPLAHAGATFTAGPLRVSTQELATETDAVAFRLMRAVFAAFGYSEAEIRAYDPTTRRFRF